MLHVLKNGTFFNKSFPRINYEWLRNGRKNSHKIYVKHYPMSAGMETCLLVMIYAVMLNWSRRWMGCSESPNGYPEHEKLPYNGINLQFRTINFCLLSTGRLWMAPGTKKDKWWPTVVGLTSKVIYSLFAHRQCNHFAQKILIPLRLALTKKFIKTDMLLSYHVCVCTRSVPECHRRFFILSFSALPVVLATLVIWKAVRIIYLMNCCDAPTGRQALTAMKICLGSC